MTNFFIYKSGSKHFRYLRYLVLVFLFSFGLHAQNSVSGTVSDASGLIPGANVLIKGTSVATSTNFDGTYVLKNVPNGSVLVFSFMGLKTQEITLTGQSIVNVVLLEDAKQLKEVVVIGYGGVVRKESVTGSVYSISGKDLRDVPTVSISQALQGRAAGIEISQSSSKPGANVQIRVRGTRSITANNEPLVVLDGIPFSGTIADINPNNIKSIDVLKDASSTAIYGSRGSNGVILVTSITGTKGSKPQITYSNFFGLKSAFGRYPMMNGPEFVALRKAAGQDPTNGIDEKDDVNIDWQDLMYRTSTITSHDISMVGGTETGSYNFGLGYLKDEAILPGQNFQRYAINAGLDQQVGRFRLGFSTNSNYSISNGNNLSLFNTLSTTPIANPYNADGTLKRVVEMSRDQHWVYTRESINNLGAAWIDQTKAFGSYNNIYGELKIPGVDGLKYRLNVGMNIRTTTGGTYTGRGVFSVSPTTPSNAGITNSINTSYVLENILSYDKTFAEKHKVNLVGLFSNEQTTQNNSSVSALDVPDDNIQFYNLATATGVITINNNNQGYQQNGLKSMMGRAIYSFNDKYLLTGTLRHDESSRLAPGKKGHTYTAFSAGWNLKNESFLKNVNGVNLLKIRAGYGETSNQGVDPYKTLGLLGIRLYNFGDTNASGYLVSELPNQNLGWEYSNTLNYGLDFGFFNNRLTGTVEYYKTKTTDLLLSVALPPTAGAGSFLSNVGSTENKGYELSLRGLIIDNPNGWSLEAGVNFYTNKNKILSLSNGSQRDVANNLFVGESINVVYDYEKIGLWNTTDADYQYITALEGGGNNAGMIKVKYNGGFAADGTPLRAINPDDRKVINLDPDFQGGFNMLLSYKGFDLGAVGVFRSGGKIVSTLYGNSGYLNNLTGRRNNVKVDYWTPENTDAKYPKPGGAQTGDGPKYGSTMSYFDGSYLKFRTLTFGYNFEDKLLQNTGISKFRLYCTVQNPFVLFSPYYKESGMDPETNTLGNDNATSAVPGYNRRTLVIGTNTPSTRNLVLGLNVTF